MKVNRQRMLDVLSLVVHRVNGIIDNTRKTYFKQYIKTHTLNGFFLSVFSLYMRERVHKFQIKKKQI